MHVLTSMGISGQRDVPVGRSGAVEVAGPVGGSGVVHGDAGLIAVSFASPPTDQSGGAAAGIGMGLMLSGGASDPARAIQVVAWVPADQANSSADASALALRKVEEARKKAFAKGLSKLPLQTDKYPDGHSCGYASPKDSYAERPIPYSDEIAQCQWSHRRAA